MRHGNLHSNVNQKFRSQSHPPRPATKSQLPHQRNSTTRTRRKQSGERARAQREVTNCKNRRAANKTNWQAASNTLQGQRVAASFCAQETTSTKRIMNNGLAMISSSRLAPTPRQLGSSAPRKTKSVSTAKVLRERIKRNDDERLPRLLDCRKWKTTARPRKTLRQPETTTGPRKTRARRRKRARGHPPTRDS